jgi:hypothetical protein
VENLADQITAFEDGELDGDETVALFQKLVDTGLAWELQGYYGRFAAALIKDGLVTTPGPEPGVSEPGGNP